MVLLPGKGEEGGGWRREGTGGERSGVGREGGGEGGRGGELALKSGFGFKSLFRPLGK